MILIKNQVYRLQVIADEIGWRREWGHGGDSAESDKKNTPPFTAPPRLFCLDISGLGFRLSIKKSLSLCAGGGEGVPIDRQEGHETQRRRP